MRRDASHNSPVIPFGELYPLHDSAQWALLLPPVDGLDLTRAAVRLEPEGLRIFHVPGRPSAGWLLSVAENIPWGDVLSGQGLWLSCCDAEGRAGTFYFCRGY